MQLRRVAPDVWLATDAKRGICVQGTSEADARARFHEAEAALVRELGRDLDDVRAAGHPIDALLRWGDEFHAATGVTAEDIAETIRRVRRERRGFVGEQDGAD